MRVLLQTAELVIVDKPAGVPTIPDRFGSDSVHDQLQRQQGERLWIVHRLDREVTGILAFARTAKAHAALSQAFEARRVHKTYAAWTTGEAPGPAGTQLQWRDKLLRGKKRSYAHPAGKEAWTDAVFDGVDADGHLRWTLHPRTGRNHQLRVHLASRGWPIVGDVLYGSPVPWRPSEIALRAVRLEIPPGVLAAPLDLTTDALTSP